MAAQVNEHIRYEPDEHPPPLAVVGVGAQAAMLTVPGVVLAVVIVTRIAQHPDSYMSWAVFAAMLVSGLTTILQAVRVGRIGAGHVLIMGTSGAFIAVCVARGRARDNGEPRGGLVAVPVRDGGDLPPIVVPQIMRH